jgi:glycine/serine hydroxymethyltransferase
MAEPEMDRIAALIGRALRAGATPGDLDAVRDEVGALCSKFPPYPAA